MKLIKNKIRDFPLWLTLFTFLVGLILGNPFSIRAQFTCKGCLLGVDQGSTSAGDFNEDSHTDLLITGLHDRSATSTLYLGDGGGGFTKAGAGLDGVAFGSTSVADVNGDDHLDLLITGSWSATLYLGDGTGSFSKAEVDLPSFEHSSASIADVDGNGHPDLLITGKAFEGLISTIYLGDGNGGFSKAGASLTGVMYSSSSIADVNSDGAPDLLITGRDIDWNPTATLYLGDGNGSFSKAEAGLTGVWSGSTSIADVDGDGNPDLLITGRYSNGNPSATLYLGDGDGGFSKAEAGLTGVRYSSSSIADVDRDGHLDLLIAGENSGSNPTATLYLGDGTGSFSVADAGLTGVKRYSSSLVAGVDSDGHPDLLITGQNADGNPTTTLYLGDGNGNFSKSGPQLSHVSHGSSSIADIDGNSHSDLLITGRDSSFNLTATLYMGEENGSFSKAGASLTGVWHSSSSIADVDSDGVPDLLITGMDIDWNPTTTLYLGEGNGSFSKAGAGLTGVMYSSSSIADVNGDGQPDLLITGLDVDRNPTATLYVGDGDGEFSKVGAGLDGVAFGSTSIADMNDDDHLDLLITGSWSATLYLGDGTGSFSKAEVDLPRIRNSSSSIADVNGDGHPDLLITGEVIDDGLIANLYLGDGTGSFSKAGAGLTGVRHSTSSIADIDRDGQPDLLIAGQNANRNPTTTLYLGDGAGGFTQAKTGLAGVENGSVSIADLDNDSDKDILFTGMKGHPLTGIYFNRGNGFTQIKHTNGVPDTYQLAPNYPNPFNPTTKIQFSLKQAARVNISVYDVLGRHIRTLIQEKRHAGQHTITFDASGLSSGVYIYQLKTDHYTKSRKMLFVK